ncbi:MAG: pyridoxine 5'-phosphate synthase, partial [Planctomycetes bacterium]|nr:pyridoxine 5'-phosphate synthase [Planctomycetota bacterium]
MPALGVNIDHVATVRQARYRGVGSLDEAEPDPVRAAHEAELGGADGITVHLREDRRHIQDRDVELLRRLVRVKLNLEMAATDEMLGIAERLKPHTAMLVPEGRLPVLTLAPVAADTDAMGDPNQTGVVPVAPLAATVDDTSTVPPTARRVIYLVVGTGENNETARIVCLSLRDAPQGAAPVPAPVVPDDDQAKRVEAGRLKKMSEENAQLKAKMAEKDTLIVNLNSQLYSRPPVPAPRETVPEPEPKSTVDEELEALSQQMEQDFGKDAMRYIKLSSAKEAREVVENRVAPISEDITRDREGRFIRELDGLVPDLDLINNDAEFVAWLSQKDARSGMSYHDLLNQSYQARDAN